MDAACSEGETQLETGERGVTLHVMERVEALCYNPEGRGFDLDEVIIFHSGVL
jgi:hypothetical protein